MKHILKILKKYSFYIILVFVLLFMQANCDLTLPEYTSNIVNIGIQQSGIESPVPEVIREEEYNKLLLFPSVWGRDWRSAHEYEHEAAAAFGGGLYPHHWAAGIHDRHDRGGGQSRHCGIRAGQDYPGL